MICSRCQLPTGEADLTEGLCGPCRGEDLDRRLESQGFLTSWQEAAAEGMCVATAEGERVPVVTMSYEQIANSKAPLESIRCSSRPVVMPGRLLYGVEFRDARGEDGRIDLTSERVVESFVRSKVRHGSQVLAVRVVREMPPDEPGDEPTLVPITEWSRGRIDACALRRGEMLVEVSEPDSRRGTYRAARHVEMTGLTTLTQSETETDRRVRRVLAEAREAFEQGEQVARRYLESRQRRLKAFGVDRGRVLEFLTKGCRYVTGDIPEDAEILEVHDDPMLRMFVFTLRHDSFPPVPPGQVLELIRPVWSEENRYYQANGNKFLGNDEKFVGNKEVG